MKLLRFRCCNCGLEMMLEKRPVACMSCGSCEVVREGWKLRAKTIIKNRSQEESDEE